MKYSQLSIAILVTIVASVNGQLPYDAPCYSDATCASYCCSNNEDYKVEGFCEPTADNGRCVARASKDIKILISFYAVLVAALGLCAYVKIKQERNHTEYL